MCTPFVPKYLTLYDSNFDPKYLTLSILNTSFSPPDTHFFSPPYTFIFTSTWIFELFSLIYVENSKTSFIM